VSSLYFLITLLLRQNASFECNNRNHRIFATRDVTGHFSNHCFSAKVKIVISGKSFENETGEAVLKVAEPIGYDTAAEIEAGCDSSTVTSEFAEQDGIIAHQQSERLSR
jgi:hypothetical protein